MYNKTIWNSGDIITQDKWDNINNNLSILGAYQLPIVDETPNPIFINKSYEEITSLLKQGIICYYLYDNKLFYIMLYNNTDKSILAFNAANTERRSFYSQENNTMCQKTELT